MLLLFDHYTAVTITQCLGEDHSLNELRHPAREKLWQQQHADCIVPSCPKSDVPTEYQQISQLTIFVNVARTLTFYAPRAVVFQAAQRLMSVILFPPGFLGADHTYTFMLAGMYIPVVSSTSFTLLLICTYRSVAHVSGQNVHKPFIRPINSILTMTGSQLRFCISFRFSDSVKVQKQILEHLH